jgi:hypothetical protein
LARKPAIRQNYGPTRTQLIFHCGNGFLLDRGGSPILDFVVLFCLDHINATTQSVTHIAFLDRLQLAASSINTAKRNMFLNIIFRQAPGASGPPLSGGDVGRYENGANEKYCCERVVLMKVSFMTPSRGARRSDFRGWLPPFGLV